jgi:hypothetical protein
MMDKMNDGFREAGETGVKVEEEAEVKSTVKAEIKSVAGVKGEEKVKKYACCTFPWYSLTVFYDGRVFLCPQDFEGRICLGDAGREKIEEIFNGGIIRDMRRRFRYNMIDDIVPCRNCDRIRRKTFMGVPVEYLKIFLRDNLIE